MRSINRLLLFAPSVLLLASCGTMITVAPDDTSAPEFTVMLPAADVLAATYTDRDGEAIEATIDVSREFKVTVPNDRRVVQLLIIAADQQSGIYQLRGRLDVSFTCRATVLGGPVERRSTASVLGSAPEGTPSVAAPGSSTPDRRSAVVQLNLEDLWRQGNCSTWDAVIGHDHGSLTDIEVSYRAQAWNNTYPVEASSHEINGTFAIDNASVDLSH